MTNIEMILNTIEYIEDNIEKNISIKMLADYIGYSQYHLIRLFKAITGHTPKDYIIRRKITEAAFMLKDSKKKITEIAFELGFENYETFTRAFKSRMGISPYMLRENIGLKDLPILDRIEKNDLENLKYVKGIEPIEVYKESFKIAGMATLIKKSTDVISELWEKVMGESSSINVKILPEKYYQVGFWSNKFELEEFFIMVGLEVNEFDNSIILVNKEIPSSNYLKFQHKGLCKDVGLTYKYIYESFFPQSNYKLSYPYQFEVYGDNFYGPNNKESITEIFIPIE